MSRWLLFLLVASAASENCPSQTKLEGRLTPACSTNVIVVLDATSYLTDPDIPDKFAFGMGPEFNFVWDSVLPSLNYSTGGQKVAFVSYGASSKFNPLTSSYSEACQQMTDLKNDARVNGGKNVTLTTLMNQLHQNYKDILNSNLHIQLISASEDPNDIWVAGKFVTENMPTVSFTILSLTRPDYWQYGFPHFQLIVSEPSRLTVPTDGGYYARDCMVTTSCGSRWGCLKTTPAPKTTTVTRAPTTTTTGENKISSSENPKTQTTTETPAAVTSPATSTQSPISNNQTTESAKSATVTTARPETVTITTSSPRSTTTRAEMTTTAALKTTTSTETSSQCPRNYPTVWNDVIFLFDASQSTGNLGLQELLGYIQYSFTDFNIQKASQNNTDFHTRIGIITYGSTVQTQYSLGTLDGKELQSLCKLPYQGGTLTNLDVAIKTAVNQLKGPKSRPNARPVIVILASGYNPSPKYPDPKAAAEEFTNVGGVIVVYEFNRLHTSRSSVLESFASPGFYILNTENNGFRMQDAMCDANCHCPDPAMQFSSPTATADGLCYTPVPTFANFNIASNKCHQFGNGTIAQATSSEKTLFLESLFSQKTNFLAGMKWDNFSGSWLWVDGTPVTGGYQPWFSGIPSHQTGSDCVYVYNNGGLLQWVPTDCRNGFFYVCETQACSSTRFCKVM